MTQIERALISGLAKEIAPEPFADCWKELEEVLYQHLG